jgi:hypothetical protein
MKMFSSIFEFLSIHLANMYSNNTNISKISNLTSTI